MSTNANQPPYRNTSLPFKQRAIDLVSRMTLDEKVSQMVHEAAAIPRLGVPAYNWWNECLHGVGRAGIATVFPQAIGLAATWDAALMRRVATAISDEARAKHHDHIRKTGGDCAQYYGLTFWSPNVNLFRDPRWGRGQETYGEDPYLTGRMGVEFVKALQGDNPKYLKLVATPKHYAAHSGPEALRHGFNAVVSQRDLRETYLPAFKACIMEGGALSIMPAYSRTNGEACGASKTLLGDILRGEWGFTGYVVSDCGAISDIYLHHKLASSKAEAAALAVTNGCDLNCGDTFCALGDAVYMGLIGEDVLDRALVRLFEARFRLGMFDPPEMVPYASIPFEVNDCEAHRQLARQAARESLVLLKNDGVLPLPANIRSLAVVGPNADDVDVLLGNYNGTPSRAVTPLQGIRARAEAAGVAIRYAPGCDLVGTSTASFADAVEAAQSSDVAVAVMGISPRLEGEEGESDYNRSGDRVEIGLPGVQEGLLAALHATGKPVVLVLLSGSCIALGPAGQQCQAVLEAWYGGEEAGTALAEALFGDYSPAGRLPITFYRSLDQLPPFEEYNMRAGQGRTYRFFTGDPLYPFGHGLSYSSFAYSDLQIAPSPARVGQDLEVSATVTNVGDRESDEVAQLYVSDRDASVPVPLRQLQGFARVHLRPGESARLTFTLKPDQLVCYTDDGVPMVEPGTFIVSVGGGQPGTAAPVVIGEFDLVE